MNVPTRSTPEEIVFAILNKKQTLSEAKQEMYPQLSYNLNAKKMILNANSEGIIDNQNSIIKATSSSEYKFTEECFLKFNEYYKQFSELISVYFKNELLQLYSQMESIFHSFEKTFDDMTPEHYENLKIVAQFANSTLLNLVNLVQVAKQSRDQEIKLWKEQEMMKEFEKVIEILMADEVELLVENEVIKKVKRLQKFEQLDIVNNINKFEDNQLSSSVTSHSTDLLDSFSETNVIDLQYRNNIQKVVNHICSQITSSNPNHSLGRLKELIRLLEKKDIPLVGSPNVVFNLRKHSHALDQCWVLLQNTVLTQAETQLSMSIETAVTFASLLSAVLGLFPDRMENMLCCLHEKYMLLLGSNESYECSDEKEEAACKLKGISRLLAALLVAHPPPGYGSHPKLCPAYLWKLLSRICNAEIKLSFSSEACTGLLEMGANTLWDTYGHQFEKLLIALRNKFEHQGSLSERSVVLMIDMALSIKAFKIQGYPEYDVWSAIT